MLNHFPIYHILQKNCLALMDALFHCLVCTYYHLLSSENQIPVDSVRLGLCRVLDVWFIQQLLNSKEDLFKTYTQLRVIMTLPSYFHTTPLLLRAFRISAPKNWNTLPLEVCQSHSLPTFRNRLKTFCFRSAYPSS